MRKIVVTAALSFLLSGPVAADEPPPRPDLAALGAAVSLQSLKTTIATLVAFGTRHTMSDTASATRGIGAARRWVQRVSAPNAKAAS